MTNDGRAGDDDVDDGLGVDADVDDGVDDDARLGDGTTTTMSMSAGRRPMAADTTNARQGGAGYGGRQGLAAGRRRTSGRCRLAGRRWPTDADDDGRRRVSWLMAGANGRRRALAALAAGWLALRAGADDDDDDECKAGDDDGHGTMTYDDDVADVDRQVDDS